MSEIKFRADLYCDFNKMPGHFIFSDSKFLWKPMKWFPHFGHIEKVEVPISDLVAYYCSGFLIWQKLYLEFAGQADTQLFWAPSAKSIVYELRLRNPSIIEKESLKDTIIINYL
ncbi:MAG: hypothetical protein IKQ37_08555 [Bacteroidaceae bacterium]|nr:hypothetical protein [Bacteroidaceae bacterium]